MSSDCFMFVLLFFLSAFGLQDVMHSATRTELCDSDDESQAAFVFLCRSCSEGSNDHVCCPSKMAEMHDSSPKFLFHLVLQYQISIVEQTVVLINIIPAIRILEYLILVPGMISDIR